MQSKWKRQRRGAAKAAARRAYKRYKRSQTSGKQLLRRIGGSQVYPFKRFVHAKVTINGDDTVSAQVGAVSFSLSDVTAVADFTTLFDQFKIAGIAYRWCIGKDPMYPTAGTNSTRFFPRLVWVHDYDDNNPPSAITDLYQYPKMREFWFTGDKNATPWQYIKPARLDVGFENTVNSSYHPVWKGFTDMASTSTPFYGIKYATQQNYSGMQIYLQCKYYLIMKNVR